MSFHLSSDSESSSAPLRSLKEFIKAFHPLFEEQNRQKFNNKEGPCTNTSTEHLQQMNSFDEVNEIEEFDTADVVNINVTVTDGDNELRKSNNSNNNEVLSLTPSSLVSSSHSRSSSSESYSSLSDNKNIKSNSNSENLDELIDLSPKNLSNGYVFAEILSHLFLESEDESQYFSLDQMSNVNEKYQQLNEKQFSSSNHNGLRTKNSSFISGSAANRRQSSSMSKFTNSHQANSNRISLYNSPSSLNFSNTSTSCFSPSSSNENYSPNTNSVENLVKLSINNVETLLSQIKTFFNKEHFKGIQKGDIDVFSLCKRHEINEIEKLFELVLCVLINSSKKNECIEKIMSFAEETQQYLAEKVEASQNNRLCELEEERKHEIYEELHKKEAENEELSEENEKLRKENGNLLNRVEELEEELMDLKQATKEERYKEVMALNGKDSSPHKRNINQHQKTFFFSNTYDGNQNNFFGSAAEDDGGNYEMNSELRHRKSQRIETNLHSWAATSEENYSSIGALSPSSYDSETNLNIQPLKVEPQSQFSSTMSPSFSFSMQQSPLLLSQELTDLKHRLVTEQLAHENELSELEQEIALLTERLEASEQFESMFKFAEEKHQEQLSKMIEKLEHSEKEKSKLKHEIYEKEMVIESLEDKVIDINENCVMLEKEKLDVEMLMEKVRNQQNCLKKRRAAVVFSGINGDEREENEDGCGARSAAFVGVDGSKFSLQQTAPQKHVLFNQQRISEEFSSCSKKGHQRSESFNLNPNGNSLVGGLNLNPVNNPNDTSIFPTTSPAHNQSAYLPGEHSIINQSHYVTELMLLEEEEHQNNLLEEANIERRRLERRNAYLQKENENIKIKLIKMRKLEQENKKLEEIVIDMHTEKNTEVELLIGVMMEGFVEQQKECKKLQQMQKECSKEYLLNGGDRASSGNIRRTEHKRSTYTHGLTAMESSGCSLEGNDNEGNDADTYTGAITNTDLTNNELNKDIITLTNDQSPATQTGEISKGPIRKNSVSNSSNGSIVVDSNYETSDSKLLRSRSSFDKKISNLNILNAAASEGSSTSKKSQQQLKPKYLARRSIKEENDDEEEWEEKVGHELGVVANIDKENLAEKNLKEEKSAGLPPDQKVHSEESQESTELVANPSTFEELKIQPKSKISSATKNKPEQTQEQQEREFTAKDVTNTKEHICG